MEWVDFKIKSGDCHVCRESHWPLVVIEHIGPEDSDAYVCKDCLLTMLKATEEARP